VRDREDENIVRSECQLTPSTFHSGIGLETSILFAQEGANVLLVDVNFAAVERAARLIAEKCPNVMSLPQKADVGKEADLKAAVETAVEKFGRLDVMVRSFQR